MKRRNGRFKLSGSIRKQQRNKSSGTYEKMMKTLLLQNQQIIIQQQNMMFMVMRQYQPQTSIHSSHTHQQQNQQQQPEQQIHPSHSQQSQPPQHHLQNQHHQQQHQQQQQQQQQQEQHNIQIIQHHITQDQSSQSHQIYSQSSTNLETDHQLQQVASQIQESLGNYLTPAASELDPINDKDDDLVALLEGDGLLHNNLLYNPQTDIGSTTPYKNHQQAHQTPSYYSSGCESLSTPRVETQKQPTTTNISQNVVKNLADSFKSPTKPKINVQIMSAGSATGSMKNSKAKIIQRMNISEFLRHVHPETDEGIKSTN